MKPLLIVGIVLILLGGAALAYRGFSVTKQEKIFELGPIQATAETTERIPIPPALGWAMLVGGGLAVAGGLAQSRKA
jgi:hypothetical protein